MKLIDALGPARDEFEKAGFILPRFDREALKERTRESPEWVHFGAGNIFRSFVALALQRVIEAGGAESGLVAVGGRDAEFLDRAYRPFDNLGVLVTLGSDGSTERTVIGSVVESLSPDPAGNDWKRLQEIFRSPSLKIASLTVTEKAYALDDGYGEYRSEVLRDFAAGPFGPEGIMARLAGLCHERYAAGGSPVALVSMDNCSQNGDRIRAALLVFANAWTLAGHCKSGFSAWLSDPRSVSYPWTMIDKITPSPDESIARELSDAGLEGMSVHRTRLGSVAAPFVNAEAPGYLAIEDSFPNGRPRLELGGIYLTDRGTVERMERMKVGACLNPLHTALAVFGCLLGFERIYDEMRDPALSSLARRLGYEEGLPVAADPGIVEPRAFLREVLESRLVNPFLPDTPWRIACDTSQKLPVRFGGTLKAWRENPSMDETGLTWIPLVFAGWCRYLMGVNDRGERFEPSPDARLAQCEAVVEKIRLGDRGPFSETLRPLLSDATIFGTDLFEFGLADRVLSFFGEMVRGPGAVRETLERLLGQGS